MEVKRALSHQESLIYLDLASPFASKILLVGLSPAALRITATQCTPNGLSAFMNAAAIVGLAALLATGARSVLTNYYFQRE